MPDADKTAQRRARNAPYAVPEAITNAAVDAAYREFCRSLGHWDPQFPGQRDALRRALRHSWEISANLIEAAVLATLVDELRQRASVHWTAAHSNPEGSSQRTEAIAFLVTTQSIIELVAGMVHERDAFHLVEMGGAET